MSDGCGGRVASSERRVFEPCAGLWNSMGNVRLMSRAHRESQTRSHAQKAGWNAMKCAANTFGSRIWSAPPDRQGGNSRGEQDPRVRCSPLTDPVSSVSPAPWRLKAADLTVAKRLCGCQLQQSQTGGDLCRPLSAGRQARRSLRELWRERPRVETPCAAKPAASAWSLTPQRVTTVEIDVQRDLPAVTTADPPRCSAASFAAVSATTPAGDVNGI